MSEAKWDVLGINQFDIRIKDDSLEVLDLFTSVQFTEIAEIMDTPLGTVMSRLHRGRKLLRKALKDVAREQGIGLEHPDMEEK